MNRKLLLIGLGIFIVAIYWSISLPVTAQDIDCDFPASARITEGTSSSNGQTFERGWNDDDVHCIDIESDHPYMSLDLTVREGSVAIYFLTSDGEWVSNGRFPFNIDFTRDLEYEDDDEYTGTVAFVPSGTSSFYVTLSIKTGSTNAQVDQVASNKVRNVVDECFNDPNCRYANPGPGAKTQFISLAREGDVSVIPFEACDGEAQISVEGVINRDDIAIHILPSTASVPNVNTRQEIRPNWNPETHMLFRFKRLTRADQQANPIWLVYIIRTGTPVVNNRNADVNLIVHIDRNCGHVPLDDASPERAVNQTVRSGTSEQGGVSVSNYCRSVNLTYIPRGGNATFWVCFDPGYIGDYSRLFTTAPSRVAFTVQQADWDRMCQNHYGSGAYAVRKTQPSVSTVCYK